MKNHLLLRLSNMVVFCKPKTIIVDGVDNAVFLQRKDRSLGCKKFRFLNSPMAKPSP